MSTVMDTIVRGLILGATVAFSSYANASNFDCDGLMKGLLRQNGGCPTGSCKYNILNGQLVGFNGGVVSKDDGATEMKAVSPATTDSNGVSGVRIDTGKDGSYRMSLSVVDDKGRTTKSEFGMTAKDGACVHEQTERKNPTDALMNVDYDREFCAAAANAYEGLDAAQAKTCDDTLKNLVGKYEERTNALAKDRKSFRMANASNKINAKLLANTGNGKQGQDKLIEALKQKDQCAKAATEVEFARPLSSRLLLQRLFEPNRINGEVMTKEAWPLKDYMPKGSGTRK
ncbi:hypothetical protein BH10BDE1_BH10BDE1_00190 [soil metagenome]